MTVCIYCDTEETISQQNAFAYDTCGWLVMVSVSQLVKIGLIRLMFVTTKVRINGQCNNS